MLVLTRKQNQKIVIDDRITITVLEVHGHRVRLGIEAPLEVPVNRQEIYDRLVAEQQQGCELVANG